MIIISKTNYYKARIALNDGKRCYGRVKMNNLYFHFFTFTNLMLDFKIEQFIEKMRSKNEDSKISNSIFKCKTVEFLQSCDVHYSKIKTSNPHCHSLKIAPLLKSIKELRAIS